MLNEPQAPAGAEAGLVEGEASFSGGATASVATPMAEGASASEAGASAVPPTAGGERASNKREFITVTPDEKKAIDRVSL